MPSQNSQSCDTSPGPSHKPADMVVSINETRIQCPTCHLFITAEEIAVHADLCAENAHRRAFLEIIEELPAGIDEPPQDPQTQGGDLDGDDSASTNKSKALSEILSSFCEVLKPQSRINVRRGQLFMDYVEARKRCPWLKAESKLKVVFTGEPAEDTGGPRREFLTGAMLIFCNQGLKNMFILYGCY